MVQILASLAPESHGSEGSDLMSLLALLVSVLALAITCWQWWKDQRAHKMERNADLVRSNVIDLLVAKDGGLRTIAALEDEDDKLKIRLKMLRRTALQLDTVGEDTLATALEEVLQDWDPDPSDGGDDEELDQPDDSRERFYALVKKRLADPAETER